jgi:hypothetical protein
MTKQRTNRASTIGADPFATLIPQQHKEVANSSPSPASALEAANERQKLTVHLDHVLINRVKNAAYWNPRLTIAKIAERGIRQAIDDVERENGGPYEQREAELSGGRPIK